MPRVHQVAVSSTAVSRRKPHATQSAVLQSFNQYGGAYSFGHSIDSHPTLGPFPHGREEFSLPGFLPPNDTVNSKSVVGVTPGNSSVVTGFQVDEFTCIWLAEHFVA